jgi:hypothetical protein
MSLIQKRFLFIKNANFKSCINCVNFIEDKPNYSSPRMWSTMQQGAGTGHSRDTAVNYIIGTTAETEDPDIITDTQPAAIGLQNNKLYGKCKKFGDQDFVTGEIDNTYAAMCRIDNAKCGSSAKYFEQKLK